TRFPLSLEDAAEPGAGECRPRQVIPAQTLTLGEPSREIRPTQLPDSAENSDRSMWLIGSDELSTMRPGQWFRLFIVDSGLPGHVHDPDGPRRIVTDERNELPYVAPNNWNSR